MNDDIVIFDNFVIFDIKIRSYEWLVELNKNNHFDVLKNLVDIYLCRKAMLTLGNSQKEIDNLKNSFENLSGGRKKGTSDASSFFRSGISGDWKKYFDNENKGVPHSFSHTN